MATLTVQSVTNAGAIPTYTTAAGGGDAMAVGDRNFLHVKNGGGSGITVTVTATLQCSQGSVHSISAVSVANASEKMFGPITNKFADTSGLAQITYSGVTSVTVGAFALSANA